MMKHIKLFGAALAAAAVLLPVGFASAAGAKPSFVSDGTFSVCQDPTFPPMEFVDEGSNQPVGVDVDVVSALSALWGAEPSIVTMDFNGLLPSLSAGRCDAVVSGATLTEERQKTFDGIGYLNTFVVIIAKAGAAPLAGSADLAGKTIAVQSGTTYVERMEAINADLVAKGVEAADVQLYPKQTDAIQQLKVGRVDGVMTQDTEVAFREFQNPGQFTTIWTVPQKTFQPYAIYIRKDGEDKMAVSAAIKTLVADGTMGSIIDKWRLQPSQLEGIGQ